MMDHYCACCKGKDRMVEGASLVPGVYRICRPCQQLTNLFIYMTPWRIGRESEARKAMGLWPWTDVQPSQDQKRLLKELGK